LTTVRASRAAGRQRAGRAGREAPGTVYRCWAEAEDGRLPRFPAPEIAVADLTAFALQAACWGDPDASGLALLDPPPAGAMAAARSVLTAIGAVDPEGRAARRGARRARLGLHPRLGRALLDAAPVVGAEFAAEVVALLSEEAPREYGDDLAGALRAARRGGDGYAARWRAEVRRLRSSAGEVSGGHGGEVSGGIGGEATAEPAGGPGAQAGRAEGPDGPNAQAGRPEGPDSPDAQAGRAGAPDVPVGPVAGENARAGLV